MAMFGREMRAHGEGERLVEMDMEGAQKLSSKDRNLHCQTIPQSEMCMRYTRSLNPPRYRPLDDKIEEATIQTVTKTWRFSTRLEEV